MVTGDINRKIQELKSRHRCRSAWQRIVVTMCCVVVFCVTYALILPAITMEKAPDVPQGESGYSLAEEQEEEAETADSGSSAQPAESTADDPQEPEEEKAASDNTVSGETQDPDGTGEAEEIRKTEEIQKTEETQGTEEIQKPVTIKNVQATAGDTTYTPVESMGLTMYRCVYYKELPASAPNGSLNNYVAQQISPSEKEMASYPDKPLRFLIEGAYQDDTFCLIPVHYFESVFQASGYTFSETDAQKGICPFYYSKSFTFSKSSSLAEYIQWNGNWYVKIETFDSAGLAVGAVFYAEMTEEDDTFSPVSTVINLFDYWSTANRSDDDNHNTTEEEMESGINAGHALKFGRSIPQEGYGDINYSWGGGDTPSRVTQGIVNKVLGSDGYPEFSGTSGQEKRTTTKIDQYLGDGEQESFSYLFDPSAEAAGKASFSNVTNLLTRNAAGYSYYNCTERAAELDESTCRMKVYNSPGVYNASAAQDNAGFGVGQFFPFNDAHQTAFLQADRKPMNHYFGMSMTTRFIQEHHGYTSAKQTTPVTFQFSGDNDVWIFIDGVLVADLGGLRSAASVDIDFVTGNVTINDMYGAQNGAVTGTRNTTIRQAFVEALNPGDPRLDASKWRSFTGEDGTESFTFADNTTHTLKFYYLERGNFDSNLKLQFNLIEIPPTSIYKVDQYGQTLKGAGLAVYPAVTDSSGNYRYKTAADDTTGVTLSKDAVIDETSGVITDGGIVITPAYVGTTDSKGEMIFRDSIGSLYTISDLEVLFGRYFILREIKVPDGYRTVSDETFLRIEHNQILCSNTFRSGVWASANAQVTATNELHIAEVYKEKAKAKDIGDANGVIDYYDLYSAEEAKGTLFAVVLKRNGKTINEIDDWYPVYGSPSAGYTVSNTNGIQAVIDAAKTAQTYGSTVFKQSASGMQVTLEALPGRIQSYYTYMEQSGCDLPGEATDTDPQYFVAYYYTTAADLEHADGDNTVRVISRKNIVSGYDGFTIRWGTTIRITNIENRLFFQKLNENNDLVNGAVFALYEVYDATPKDAGDNEGYAYIYYKGRDAEGKTVYAGILDKADGSKDDSAIVFGQREDGTAYVIGRGAWDVNKEGLSPETINTATGEIADQGADLGKITITIKNPAEGSEVSPGTEYYVFPAANAKGEALLQATHDICDYVAENGTGHFTNLKTGKYYLREIYAPDGYKLNHEEIPVLIDQNGVYANAGTADNGVSVGNGVGYIVSTMDLFASMGEIDETLSWIYGALIRNDAKDFSAFEKVSGDVIHVGEGTSEDTWKFVSKDPSDPNVPTGYGTGESLNRYEALVTYLYYDGKLSGNNALFDYTPGDQDYQTFPRSITVTTNEGDVKKQLQPGEGIRCLYTDEGWSDMAIYQDHEYGLAQTSQNPITNYTNLTDYGNISNLFSSSTFVQVTDEPYTTDIVVKKVNGANQDEVLSGAQFRLYRIPDAAPATVQYYSLSASGTVQWLSEEEKAAAAVVTTGSDGLGKVFSSLTDGTYYLEEIQAPHGYILSAEAAQVRISGGVVTAAQIDSLDLAVSEGDLDPVTNRYVYTVTIPNVPGHTLPETGGWGTLPYTLSGLLLLAVAFLAFLDRKNKKKFSGILSSFFN